MKKTILLISAFFFNSFMFGQINWTKYSNNPVHGWGSQPSIIFENDTFKMWFAYGILENDSVKIVTGYATSTDGINWTDYPDNPVFDVSSDSSWDSRVHDTPFVLHDSSGYKMWYTGSDHIGYPWADSLVMVIGYATSPDGIHWTKYPNPVLTKGPTGSWDRLWLESPTVIYDEGVYKMWYTGESTETGVSLSQVGYATSPDGINWTKDSIHNPVLPVDATNDYVVGISSVVKIDSIYYMLYNGGSQADAADSKLDSATINLAVSYDGINWSKYYNNPLLSPFFPTIDGDTISTWAPSVIFKNDTFFMWYEGICLATSPFTYTSIPNRNNNHIAIFPNPTNNFLKITGDDIYQLDIYSLQGQLIYSQRYETPEKNVKIDITNLPQGIYFAKIKLEGNRTAFKKIIKK